MKIPYLKKDGNFRPQIRKAIESLQSAHALRVSLNTPGGYAGSVQITIGTPKESEFEAAVNLSDWTRFPARIRAAATELRDQGLTGSFLITHDQGKLEIRRINSQSQPLVSFYWVNLGDSFKEVADHKFLWAPSNAQEERGRTIVNAGWRHVPEVRKGDIVFCHESGHIIYVAIAISDAYNAPRPENRTYKKWKTDGFKIDVDLEILKTPLDTKEFRGDFIRLYNSRCSPKLFDVNGKPSQQYMIALPEGAGASILEALGETSIRIQDKISDVTQRKKETRVTQRETIIKARVGQGKYRDDVLKIWNNQCPVTKVNMPELLVASHIVSWQISNDDEKIDPFNGLSLSPAIDKLFDKGYVSFSDSGVLLVHECIRKDILHKLGIDPTATISGLSAKHRSYLMRHRETHGFSD